MPRKSAVTSIEEYLKEPPVCTGEMFAKLIIPDGFTQDTGVGDRIPCRSNGKIAKLLEATRSCPYCGRNVNVKAIKAYGEMTLADVAIKHIWRFNCEAGCFITEHYLGPLQPIVSYIKRTAIVWLRDEIKLEKAYLSTQHEKEKSND